MKATVKMATAPVAGAKVQQGKNGVVGSKESNHSNTFKKGVDYLFSQKIVRYGEHQVTKVYYMTQDQIVRRNVECYNDYSYADYKDTTGKYIREVFVIGDKIHIISRQLLTLILGMSMHMYQKELNRKHKTNHKQIETLLVRVFEIFQSISIFSDEEMDYYLKSSKLRFIIKYRKMSEKDKNVLKSLGMIYENENGGSKIKLHNIEVDTLFLAKLFRNTGLELIEKIYDFEAGIFRIFFANYIVELNDSVAAKKTVSDLNCCFSYMSLLTEERVIEKVNQYYRRWYY